MRSVPFAAALAMALFARTAMAHEYDVVLDPAQAVPAPNVTGFTPAGVATVDVNSITGLVTISGTYSGLTSDISNSYLHGWAPSGMGAGVIFGLSNTDGASGAFSGSYTLSPLEFAGLYAGETYRMKFKAVVKASTPLVAMPNQPRWQPSRTRPWISSKNDRAPAATEEIQVVPEPSTFGMLAMAMGVMLLGRRWIKR